MKLYIRTYTSVGTCMPWMTKIGTNWIREFARATLFLLHLDRHLQGTVVGNGRVFVGVVVGVFVVGNGRVFVGDVVGNGRVFVVVVVGVFVVVIVGNDRVFVVVFVGNLLFLTKRFEFLSTFDLPLRWSIILLANCWWIIVLLASHERWLLRPSVLTEINVSQCLQACALKPVV